MTKAIVMPLVKLPRLRLANLPTPLVGAPRLAATLGGPPIFIKREDLTGLALGGNKARKLEFVLADALQRGIDTLITTGSSQSNFALQLAVAARKLGMEPYLVLFRGVHPETQGNLLLQDILSSKVSIIETVNPHEGFGETIFRKMNEIADELRGKGHNPLIVPAGAFMPLGTAGWVDAAEEIWRQLQEQKIDARYLVVATGTGGTQAGLAIGAKELGSPFEVIGVSVLYNSAEAVKRIVNEGNNTAKFLGLKARLDPEEVRVYDEYMGEGYGVITKSCAEAIRLVAQTEGIFLDPVYTGKAMSGVIDLINKGKFGAEDSIVFVHTGGVPALFAYHKELVSLKKCMGGVLE